MSERTGENYWNEVLEHSVRLDKIARLIGSTVGNPKYQQTVSVQWQSPDGLRWRYGNDYILPWLCRNPRRALRSWLVTANPEESHIERRFTVTKIGYHCSSDSGVVYHDSYRVYPSIRREKSYYAKGGLEAGLYAPATDTRLPSESIPTIEAEQVLLEGLRAARTYWETAHA